MTDKLTIIGIDPGLVHTGFVVMEFDENLVLRVLPQVFDGNQKDLVIAQANGFPNAYIYIENYRPRGNIYATDIPMQKLVQEFNTRIRRGKIVDNTGVKMVVGQQLMQLFGVWDFAQKTHHQDLRSAARIAIYGALKDMELNEVLFTYAQHKLGL